METETTTATESSAQRGQSAPANVSVDQLTAMLKKSRGAKGAVARGSSPATEASATGATGKPKEEKTTTTEAAAGAVAQAGSSSDSSPESEEGRGARGEEAGTEGHEEREGDGAEGAEAADTEAGSEEESAEVDVADVPKAIRQMNKRIAKLTARAKSAEEALAAAREAQQTNRGEGRGERDESAQAQAGPGVDGRFAEDAQLKQTADRLGKSEKVIAWAEDALDALNNGGDEADYGGQKFSRAEVRQILRNAQAERAELTAAKATRQAALEQSFNRSLGQHNAQAIKAYSWLNKPEAPEHKDASQIMASMPWLMNRPDRLMLVADFVEGRKAREAREVLAGRATNGKPQAGAPPKPKPAPLPTGGSAAATRVDPKATVVKDAEDKFKQSGRAKDLVQLFKAKRAA